MSKIITIVCGLTLLIGFTSCGVREEREPVELQNDLVGSWQHVYDTSGVAACDPNTDCKCSDWFNFYSNHSFDRNLQCSYKRGSYEIVNKKLRLVYVAEYPQVYEYSLDEKELILLKENTEHTYVKKPFRVRMETGTR
jgi:hypothetical protein